MTGQQPVIYHNPRCSKSRQTLALLNERGIEPQVVEYLKTPPTRRQLQDILRLLGLKPRDLIRTGEEEYAAAGLADPALTDDQLLDAMIDHPKLIQRPIVVADGKAALGRPPEQVLEILP
jgi:arsenate reductase